MRSEPNFGGSCWLSTAVSGVDRGCSICQNLYPCWRSAVSSGMRTSPKNVLAKPPTDSWKTVAFTTQPDSFGSLRLRLPRLVDLERLKWNVSSKRGEVVLRFVLVRLVSSLSFPCTRETRTKGWHEPLMTANSLHSITLCGTIRTIKSISHSFRQDK